MNDSTDQLRELKEKLDLKWARLQAQIAAVGTERDEIDTALRVLERLNGNAHSHGATGTNENSLLILKFVGSGETEALAPKEVQERIVSQGYDLNADLVRTQLWRMAKRGTLESENGRYWKPSRGDDVEPQRDEPTGSGFSFKQSVSGGFADDDLEDVPF